MKCLNPVHNGIQKRQKRVFAVETTRAIRHLGPKSPTFFNP
jgi:hypothetical protein